MSENIINTQQSVKEQLEERKRNQLSSLFFSKEQQLCFDKSVFESAATSTSSSTTGSSSSNSSNGSDNKTEFNVDGFIADCRARLPLETVLRDLQSYAAMLTESILESINKYFPSFVGIVNDLDSTANLFSSMATPLETITNDLNRWQTVLQNAISSVQQLEKEAAESHAKKEALGMLRDAITSLTKLEELADNASQTSLSLLERAAHLASSLEWTMEGPLKGYAVVNTIKDRFEGARTAIIKQLNEELLNGIRNKNETLIIQSLRGFVALEKHDSPIVLFRNSIVRPFVAQSIAREMSARPNSQGLEAAFTRVREWITEECTPLLRSARKVSPKLEVLGGIWAEVNETLAATVPSVFSPAIPDTFHQCFSVTLRFLYFLESLCADETELNNLRAHPAYVHLTKRWNTKIYFQIRSQEIAACFEASLIGTFRQMHLTPPSLKTAATATKNNNKMDLLHLKPSVTLWDLVNKCFDSSTTFLPQLAMQFVRLSLQLLARYGIWALNGSAAKTKQTLLQVQVDEPWSGMSPSDFMFVYHDLGAIARLVKSELGTVTVEKCFASFMSQSSAAKAVETVNEAFDEAVQSLFDARSKAETLFVEAIARQCCDSLQQMYGIMTTVRAAKAAPSQPSFYVSRVFESLCGLLNAGSSSSLAAKEERDLWATKVANAVFGRCTEICGELLTSAYRTDDMIQKMSSSSASSAAATSSPSSTNSNSNNMMSDTDRFLAQLVLDVNELGKIAGALGVETDVSEPFQRLCRCVKKI